jgi:hypothetical protein
MTNATPIAYVGSGVGGTGVGGTGVVGVGFLQVNNEIQFLCVCTTNKSTYGASIFFF